MLGQEPADLADSDGCTGSEVVRGGFNSAGSNLGGSYGEDAVIEFR